MALNEFPGMDATTKGGKGGLWGKIAGAALSGLGAAAAPFTAGASIPLAMGAAGAVAPIVGNAIDPLKVEPGTTKPNMLSTAAMQDSSMTEALLKQGRDDLVKRQDIPMDEAKAKAGFIDQALGQIRARRGI